VPQRFPITPTAIATLAVAAFLVFCPRIASAQSCNTSFVNGVVQFSCTGVSPTPVPTTIPNVSATTSPPSLVLTARNGDNGRDGALFVSANSGQGGAAGLPININVNAPGALVIITTNFRTTGGSGGTGGDGYLGARGASGGAGNIGGTINATLLGLTTYTFGGVQPGILAISAGGNGGKGGNGYVSVGSGAGAPGGSGGNVTLNVGTNIYTTGVLSYGILAQSIGGGGGDGGGGWGVINGGSGASGQSGGNVAINLLSGGSVLTAGAKAIGMIGQSIGGFGGSGGGGVSLFG
jgi:hypothetical protein